MNNHNNHSQTASLISGKTLGICLALASVVITVVVFFKVPFSTLLFAGALLACPLMHVWMMRGGKHKH